MDATGCPVARSAAQHPDAPALEHGTIRWTYRQLDSIIRQQVERIRQTGIRAGDRVALCADLDEQQVALFWALLRHGNVACLLSPRLPPRAAEQAAASVQAVHWEHVRQREMPSGATLGPPVSEAGLLADSATILFSSGTTEAPKAIVHSLRAHLASASGANQNMPLHPGDRWLLSLPWSHVSGLGILVRCALASAAVVIPTDRQSPSEDLDRFAITHVSLVPTQLKRMLANRNTRHDRLQACLLGGTALPPMLVQQAADLGWPLYLTYGLTEMGSQVTTTAPGATALELRTAGRVLPGRELKIGPHDEIFVRGDTLFQGYYRTGQLHRPLDEGGWFATGDRGALTEEGFLTVTGRCDQMFISGGENIYPEEIEQALLGLGPILQSIVVAVPDAEYGQRPVAFVQSPEFQPTEWQRQLAEQLPGFKIPKHFLPWPESTESAGLKPSRRQLQILAQQHVESANQPTSPKSSTAP